VTDNCEVLKTVPEATTPSVSLSGATGTIASQLGTPFCHQEQPPVKTNFWKRFPGSASAV
jgi:hypothetical protein